MAKFPVFVLNVHIDNYIVNLKKKKKHKKSRRLIKHREKTSFKLHQNLIPGHFRQMRCVFHGSKAKEKKSLKKQEAA